MGNWKLAFLSLVLFCIGYIGYERQGLNWWNGMFLAFGLAFFLAWRMF